MAQSTIHGREGQALLLQQQLGTLTNSVTIAVRNNRPTSAVVAETTLAGLLNLIFGWELVNANAISRNFPGVDLIDQDRRIGIQVTATCSPEKVRNTIQKVEKLDMQFDRLIMLIISNDSPTKTMKAEAGSMELWNSEALFRQAAELPMERLKELTDYMDLELGSIIARTQELSHLHLPPVSALQITDFVGRETELTTIRSLFDKGSELVVLTGLGGMGKTELAVRYGRTHPGMVYFVRFDTSFTQTLENMASGLRPRLHDDGRGLDRQYLLKQVMDRLRESSDRDLLIIDNVDSDTQTLAQLQRDPLYRELSGFSLRLLLTTRAEFPRSIPVEPMPDDTLFQIFEKHGAALPRQEMEDLIRAVGGHTLTIDLIARVLNGRGWRKVTTDMLLTALRDNSLRDQRYRKIETDYSQSPDQAQIYEHLSIVFQVSGIPPLGKQVMSCAALLPDCGLEGELFGTSLEEEEQDALDKLLERGWLEARHGLLTIHPVIRLVCLTELEPTPAACEPFLDRLWTNFDQTEYKSTQYDQMAELFACAEDRLKVCHGRWRNRGGILWNALTQHKKMYDLYRPRLPALEQALPPDSPELATAYNYYGLALDGLGKYEEALAYGKMALAIRKKVLPETDPDLGHSYNNVGGAYRNLGNHPKELEYLQQALKLLENALPAEHPDIATAYNNVGLTYRDLGNHRKALEYQQKALAIRQKILPPEHPVLASSYNNMGLTYGDLGNHRKELEYQQKALTIREKALPPEHPDIANSYNNIGSTYYDLRDHRKALEYQQKALVIHQKVLPLEHPLLALSYSNIAWTHHALGELRTAAQYMRRAADIISRSSLPKTHPNRINYPKWADDYEKQAAFQENILNTMGQGGLPPLPPFPPTKK